MAANWREWATHRFGIWPIWDKILDRRVAEGSWYFGDGATLVLLLGVQVVTGAILALTYSPATNSAAESVNYITRQLPLGWFVRGLHYWSAGLMVVMLFFHLFRLILLGSYKLPREGTWFVGLLMFFPLLALSLTGYLLRWDERAVHGLQVVVAMLQRVPQVGQWLAQVVQGGPEISALSLTRLYGMHVVVLPLLVLSLAAYHLYLVILRGTTSKTERERDVYTVEAQKRIYERDARTEERGDVFYPETVLKSGAFAAVVFALAVTLVVVVGPPELQPAANLTEPSQPAEEWWFWWYSALIALLPSSLAPILVVAFPVLVFVGLMLLPLIDRSPERGWRNRPIAVTFVTLSVVALLWLSWLRYQSPWTAWPSSTPPPVPVGLTLTADAEEGRQLFSQFGCNSCHGVAEEGRQVGTDLARISRIYSRAELANYILRPPSGVAMPGYDGRLSENELERLVDFVHVVQTQAF